MCKFKSVIILKDEIFCPDYDHHQDMLSELKIEDTKANAERLFVRAELSPLNRDMFSDIDTWEFKVDQDIIPDWFVEEYEKERTTKAVKAWAEKHIYIGEKDLKIEIKENTALYLKDCANVTVKTCGRSTATVKTYGSSTATVKTCGSSTATVKT